jgi:hypothetical protein
MARSSSRSCGQDARTSRRLRALPRESSQMNSRRRCVMFGARERREARVTRVGFDKSR